MTALSATRGRAAILVPMLAGLAILAGCIAAGIGALSLADALTATGLPDPGPVTTLGLPFVRAAGEMAAVLAVGSFLLAAFLVPPQQSGVSFSLGYFSFGQAKEKCLGLRRRTKALRFACHGSKHCS